MIYLLQTCSASDYCHRQEYGAGCVALAATTRRDNHSEVDPRGVYAEEYRHFRLHAHRRGNAADSRARHSTQLVLRPSFGRGCADVHGLEIKVLCFRDLVTRLQKPCNDITEAL